jgi:uncharacterized membrane protein YkoI
MFGHMMSRACLGLLLALLPMPALADDMRVIQQMVKEGNIKPFEEIRERVMAEGHGEYVGTQFDLPSRIYRFRFLNAGTVVNVEVDARTGQRLNRRRNF